MLEQVFFQMSFLTKPALIREETLDLATSSAAVEFCLHTVDSTRYKEKSYNSVEHREEAHLVALNLNFF